MLHRVVTCLRTQEVKFSAGHWYSHNVILHKSNLDTMDRGSGAAIVPFFPLIISNVSAFTDKNVEVRALVGVFCSLSIVGSLLIILSYFLQKKKTKARSILFHISLMDLGVGIANLIGLSVYFDQYFNFSKDGNPIGLSKTIESLCKAQAFFAQLCTLASIFWTTSLAGYLYIVILHQNRKLYATYFVQFSYVCCYGLPFGVSLWSCLTGKLGYAPYDSAGWCSLITIDPLNVKKNDPFAALFGFDIWMYLAGFLIIVFYVDIRIFLSQQVCMYICICIHNNNKPSGIAISVFTCC